MDKKYTLLFNGITDTIDQLESIRQQLIFLQQTTENLYISAADAPIIVIQP